MRARLLAAAVALFVAASVLTLWLSDASSADVDRCALFERVAAARSAADSRSGPDSDSRARARGPASAWS